MPAETQRKWMYSALIAVIVLAALIAVGWYAGVGGFEEWGLFEE